MVNSDAVSYAMQEILAPVTNVEIIISEKLFGDRYLDILINPDKRKEAFNDWLNICKNPYYPVNIVDLSGKVILTVPPLLIRQKTRDVFDARYSFSEIMVRAQKKAEISPKGGEVFFDECVKHVIPIKNDTEIYTDMWRKILLHYGYIDRDKNVNDDKLVTDDDMEGLDFDDI